MRTTKLFEIFDVEYGNQFDLNKMQIYDGKGAPVNFVARTAKNNGISAIVKKKAHVEPYTKGLLTVALGGSSLSTFLQPKHFYTAQNVAVLTPRGNLTAQEKLYYSLCIQFNSYRYTACGREANRTLKFLELPDKDSIPTWVNRFSFKRFDNAKERSIDLQPPELSTKMWKWFELQELFEIKKGKRLTKANMIQGETPFIGSIDSNNGLRERIGQAPIHDGNTITVNYNGSVAESFYQPDPFWASDDVNVLYPKFNMNKYIAMFLLTIIRQEKYRFNYGRKWHMERMRISEIKLPVIANGSPDWSFMENFTKTLPFSSQI